MGALVIYLVGLIFFLYFFFGLADRGDEIWALIYAILWPLFVVFMTGLVVYDEIADRFRKK